MLILEPLITDLLGKRKSSVSSEYEDRSSSECSQEYDRHLKCPALKEDVAPLFVLPARKKQPLMDSKLGLKDKRTNTKESLVDALISDLVCNLMLILTKLYVHVCTRMK